ncbi:DUF2637 domain-containing protein [Streptomyces paludis]|uniref:DUF2637 domain-containing protein n=1 Tax=Streptomyces paludis TaxID=2282738 RepID=A0A345I126_9ACTN|nr:DUF2637 domain-containing protein [Streptomyces paludis]AXG82650.1 DUF2637 domain-containing protein [Streptomyces paludis]
MTLWDGAAIILLGSAGFAFSYDALRQIAVAIHARESLSYLFPVFIDGFIAYGVRALVLLRNRHFGARLYAWFLFLTATGASLWANALHAITLNRGPDAGRSALHLGDGVVGVLSTLAPLALAGSVHLYILMARTAESSVQDRSAIGPGPVREDTDNSPLPPLERRANGTLEPRDADNDFLADKVETPVSDSGDGPSDRQTDDDWLRELLPITRAASQRAGRISRSAVQEAVRARQPISNDRLGELLARLKEEEKGGRRPAPTGTAANSLW